MNYKLSPSDLTFLYNGCPRCFVLKVAHGIRQPSIPLPGIFTQIANVQDEFYTGRRTEDVCPHLPPGEIQYGEEWVKSRPISVPGSENTCHILGRFDSVAKLDDGSWAVIDFKTGKPGSDKGTMYGRQLHAYVAALSDAEPDYLAISPISRLGLLYFTPDACQQLSTERQVLEGDLTWLEVPLDTGAFNEFLGEVVRLLDGPLPGPAADCDWCSYHGRLRSLQSPTDAPDETNLEIPACPDCGSPMAQRNGRNGPFWGCTTYPNCRGTRNI